MSIAAMILNSENEFEKKFYLPVASEAFFEECWIPAIRELDLKWVNVFSVGLDMEKEDLPFVMKELSQIKEWAQINLSDERIIKIIERIELLEAELPNAFRREGAVVFIG
ncbi:hypothetical protein [Paenibacillus soyae]|uniref:Uncharacterized protein n=1 Tax=Paenibacillus soyae TaxID=2969249 RepID=A0A9X2SBN9_9BACL|nr:hypothetical protein [Paenibacillus soyae]MCR2805147.1 hypothetical protein [Paenibacillus soyae]